MMAFWRLLADVDAVGRLSALAWYAFFLWRGEMDYDDIDCVAEQIWAMEEWDDYA